MKRNEIIFSIVKIPLDFCMVFFSFFIARELRLVTDLIPGVQLPIQTISYENLTILSFYGATFLIVLFASHKMYAIKITSSKIKESLDIMRYSLYWFLFFSVFVYLSQGIIYHGKEIPRLIIIYTFFGTVFGLFISRLFLNEFQIFLLKKGYISKKNILIINNKSKKEVEPILSDIYETGIYSIVGYVNPQNIQMNDILYRGGFSETLHLLQSGICEEILFIDSDFEKDELLQIWESSRIFGIRYRYITNSFDVTRSNTSISLINHIPVIEINTTPLDNWGRVTKRLIDIFGSIAGIIIFSPLIIVTAILIKFEEPFAPVIYRNRRVGQKGSIFSLYKFRYIQRKYCVKDDYGVDSNDDTALAYEKKLIRERSTRSGPLYKIKNDPRKTRIGKWIEKYSIDELPQFFNVLMGNMSLVGPRPHQPREVEKYDLHHKMLLTIKPGITGMAQVHGREKNEFEEEARLDIFYIENWSFLLDLKIIFKTFVTILTRR